MRCSKCGKEKEIVNKHFKLCRECNNERLYGNKYGKTYEALPKKKSGTERLKTANKRRSKKSLFVKDFKSGKNTEDKIREDEEFYEKCFNQSDHRCEECGKQLPTEFRDEDGKIIARWRYSHVVPKSTVSELRHDLKNINNLCLSCHQEWENGNKKNMKIFAKNLANFPQYLSD